jgi:guanylate kinase
LIKRRSGLSNYMDEIALSVDEICGPNIYSRGDGRILYQQIKKALKKSSKVIVEFYGKEIASESFLDEAIIEFYLPPESPDVADRLILRNMTRPDQVLLGRILEYRKRLSSTEVKKSENLKIINNRRK